MLNGRLNLIYKTLLVGGQGRFCQILFDIFLNIAVIIIFKKKLVHNELQVDFFTQSGDFLGWHFNFVALKIGGAAVS